MACLCYGPWLTYKRRLGQVSVRILGGLMALGYEIGSMLKRSSAVWSDDALTIKIDDIEGFGRQYVQIQGRDRNAVAQAGAALGLDGTYIARSYIEQARVHGGFPYCWSYAAGFVSGFWDKQFRIWWFQVFILCAQRSRRIWLT